MTPAGRMLEGRAVAVTGGGGGIGEAIARACAREGAQVLVADIREDAARAVAESIGGRAAACDVADPAQREALAETAIAAFGRLDGLVNNAGLNYDKPFFDATETDWDRIIAVDLKAVFFLCQRVAAQMKAQGGGSILNIASVHSVQGVIGAAPYDAAKAGVLGMTRSMAIELARDRIRVNCLSPGLVRTHIWDDMLEEAEDRAALEAYWNANIPMGRIIEPEEIADAAVFLLSDQSRCITGANLLADAGLTAALLSRAPWE